MIITLTTDFGLSDPYVAQMKGVILSITPEVTLVDITHQIPPHAVLEAAWVLGLSFPYFPPGTVHVAVVDPGVGSPRRGIIVSAARQLFVGPDNGIFSHIVKKVNGAFRTVHITNLPSSMPAPSQTFHGRDVFAPVAARLAMGADIGDFGPEINDIIILPQHQPVRTGDTLVGEVVYFDRFGNAITNISASDLPAGFKIGQVIIGEKIIKPARFYTDTSDELACLINSAGFLEIFTPQGSAEGKFNLKKGIPVSLVLSPL